MRDHHTPRLAESYVVSRRLVAASYPAQTAATRTREFLLSLEGQALVVDFSGNDQPASDRPYIGLNGVHLANWILTNIALTPGDGPRSSGTKMLLKSRANHKTLSWRATKMKYFEVFI